MQDIIIQLKKYQTLKVQTKQQKNTNLIFFLPVSYTHLDVYKRQGYEVTKEKQERYKREETYMISKWDKALNNDKYFSKNNF